MSEQQTLEIIDFLTDFVNNDSRNILPDFDTVRIFDSPLVTFASAQDILFEKLKDPEVVSHHHLSPREWLPEAKSVISFFLPLSEEIRKSNRTAGLPSSEWMSGKFEGESFIDLVRDELIEFNKSLGGHSLSPAKDPRFKVTDLKANWSERHVAFIAGLGTFSLHKGLITAKGCAGRLGSIITSLELTPTERPFKEYFANCPKLLNGTCGVCIERCPSGAITEKNKDHTICRNYAESVLKPRFGLKSSCGKCQTKVPCEFKIRGGQSQKTPEHP